MLDLGTQAHKLLLASSPFEVTEELGLFSAVTLKSCTLYPISGDCLFEEIDGGSFLNRWGLDNPGVDAVVRDTLPRILRFQENVILSASFQEKNEIDLFLDKIQGLSICGLELNLSCPNKDSLTESRDIISLVRNKNLGIPIGLKIGLDFNLESLSSLGIDFVTFSNTIPYQHETLGRGGLSGRYLRDQVVQNLELVRESFNGTLIACGGVRNAEDYYKYLSLGADYVAIASQFLKNKNIVTQILLDL